MFEQEENLLTEQETELYPKFDITDNMGNPLRDARFYPFASRVIHAANKEITSGFKYSHFDKDEVE